MIFVLDNYDSFTYNLVQRLGEIDPSLSIRVARNDEVAVADVAALDPARIIVSPGPCTPNEAGISKQIIAELGPTIPILGVCLGHQCLSEVYGAQVVRAPRLMHGKTSMIRHDGKHLFADLESPFVATRYHSLIVPEATLTPELVATAWADDDGQPSEIMGVRHKTYPVFGVQFHPESFLCPSGTKLLQNFLDMPSAQALRGSRGESN